MNESTSYQDVLVNYTEEEAFQHADARAREILDERGGGMVVTSLQPVDPKEVQTYYGKASHVYKIIDGKAFCLKHKNSCRTEH